MHTPICSCPHPVRGNVLKQKQSRDGRVAGNFLALSSGLTNRNLHQPSTYAGCGWILRFIKWEVLISLQFLIDISPSCFVFLIDLTLLSHRPFLEFLSLSIIYVAEDNMHKALQPQATEAPKNTESSL